MAQELEDLKAWIGRRVIAEDTISKQPILGLASLLNHREITTDLSAAIPPLAHWLYFKPDFLQAEMPTDGAERNQALLPPVPLSRRMWAGGKLTFHQPLHIGDKIRKISEVINVDIKQGRSGTLVFVTLKHTISQGDVSAITERHDIVFRDPPKRNLVTSHKQSVRSEKNPAIRKHLHIQKTNNS